MQATISTSMTCGSCVSKVRPFLDSEPSIVRWEPDLNDPRKLIRAELVPDAIPGRLVDLVQQAGFTAALIPDEPSQKAQTEPVLQQSKFNLLTYQPLFLVITYVIGLSALVQFQQSAWLWSGFMTYFMGFFFLGFAFFKLLNVAKFADAFSTYDIVAKRSRIYGLLYPWIEVGLGLLFVTGTWLLAANIATAIVMSIGLIGVVAAVRKKQVIQCACLGTAFNLPMSVVTIIENSVMIAMAVMMLLV